MSFSSYKLTIVSCSIAIATLEYRWSVGTFGIELDIKFLLDAHLAHWIFSVIELRLSVLVGGNEWFVVVSSRYHLFGLPNWNSIRVMNSKRQPILECAIHYATVVKDARFGGMHAICRVGWHYFLATIEGIFLRRWLSRNVDLSVGLVENSRRGAHLDEGRTLNSLSRSGREWFVVGDHIGELFGEGTRRWWHHRVYVRKLASF